MVFLFFAVCVLVAVASSRSVVGHTATREPPTTAEEPTTNIEDLRHWDISCDAGSSCIFMHVQDVSPSMRPYIDQFRNSFALDYFNIWMDREFPAMPFSGLAYFTAKARKSMNPSDVCAAVHRRISYNSVISAYQTLPVDIGEGYEERSVLDALAMVAEMEWEGQTLLGGQRVAIVYTNSIFGETATDDLPSWEAGVDCRNHDYPRLSLARTALQTKGIKVLFVVTTQELMDLYGSSFVPMGDDVAVVAMGSNPEEMLWNLFHGMDKLLCGKAFTPQFPTTATKEPTTTEEPTTSTTTEELPTVIPCTQNAVLQLLHLQDMSWSYSNDLSNMKAKFPQLLSDLDSLFSSKEVALGTFVDKPVGLSGYDGDYCYRLETGFTSDDSVFIDALRNANILSGRDWKESQYDALKESLESGIGWETNAKLADGRAVLKVVIMATDAGPHEQGDLPHLPPSQKCDFDNYPCDSGCEFRDYPQSEEIKALLLERGVHPIFVVTSDIHKYWTDKMSMLSDTGRVLNLGDPDQIVEQVNVAIKAALAEVCESL